MLISPYAKATNEHEIEFLAEAGYQVVHDLGLGLTGGGDEYLRITRGSTTWWRTAGPRPTATLSAARPRA